jgi:hypothetical protein
VKLWTGVKFCKQSSTCCLLANGRAGFAGLTQQQRAVAAMQLDYKLSTALAGVAEPCVPSM